MTRWTPSFWQQQIPSLGAAAGPEPERTAGLAGLARHATERNTHKLRRLKGTYTKGGSSSVTSFIQDEI